MLDNLKQAKELTVPEARAHSVAARVEESLGLQLQAAALVNPLARHRQHVYRRLRFFRHRHPSRYPLNSSRHSRSTSWEQWELGLVMEVRAAYQARRELACWGQSMVEE